MCRLASSGIIERHRVCLLSLRSDHAAYNVQQSLQALTTKNDRSINFHSETAMKKLLTVFQIFAVALSFAGAADASGGHPGKAKGHHKHKHKHRKEVVHYYVPVAPAPAPAYYTAPVPAPQPYRQPAPDRRSTAGLAGSVVGGALGYQVGNGHPLAAGAGAAAGSLIGNEIGK
jgi:hypothetical protein